jgi:hypothetical protein
MYLEVILQISRYLFGSEDMSFNYLNTPLDKNSYER